MPYTISLTLILGTSRINPEPQTYALFSTEVFFGGSLSSLPATLFFSPVTDSPETLAANLTLPGRRPRRPGLLRPRHFRVHRRHTGQPEVGTQL